MSPLPAHLKAKLRAESLCAEQTIDRWWKNPSTVRDATDQRLTAAAHAIGLALPSDPQAGTDPRSTAESDPPMARTGARAAQ